MTQRNASKALVAVDAAARAMQMAPEAVEVIRAQVCPDFTDYELAFFMWLCHERQLNPLANDVYAFKAGGKVCIGLRIDAMRRKADETKRYLPGPTRFEGEKDGLPTDAYVTVRIFDLNTNMWVDFEEHAHMTEFRANTPTWKSMPRVMLSKCAEARALRRAFPAALGGVYEPAELEGRDDVAPQGASSMAEALRRRAAGEPIDVPAEVIDTKSTLAGEDQLKVIWNTYSFKRQWDPEKATGEEKRFFLAWAAEVIGDPEGADPKKWTIADTDKLYAALDEMANPPEVE